MSSWSWLLRVLVVLVVCAWPVAEPAPQSRSDVFGRRLDDHRGLLWYLGSDPEAMVHDASGPRPVMRSPDERSLELEDLASAESSSSFVRDISVLLADGAGGLLPAAVFSEQFTSSLSTMDVNRDGHADLLALHGDATVAVFRGDGTGGSGTVSQVTVGTPWSADHELVDLDSDGFESGDSTSLSASTP